MQKVMYFHLDTCPYCRQADEVIQELIQEHPEYAIRRLRISMTIWQIQACSLVMRSCMRRILVKRKPRRVKR